MNDLLRELAPVSDEAWEAIESEAKGTLKLMLAGRKLVDFTGPLGYDAAAVNLGGADRLAGEPYEGVETRRRRVQPLIEVRVPFELEREELEQVARGAKDVDLDPVREAARKAAMTEDRAVFHGYGHAGIQGIAIAAESAGLTIPGDYAAYSDVVVEALNKLRAEGIDGPYAIALGPRCYAGLTKTTRGGYPVMDHVRRLVDGPIVWAPAVDGAVVLSVRGGDFELVVGQDLSIGYLEHSASRVRLYLQESFTFRVITPEAAVPLRYAAGA